MRTLVAISVLALAVAPARAAPDRLVVTSGKAVLPLTGLVVQLPAQKNVEYRLSSSWSLTAADTFDSRDVIDELRRSDEELLAGTWVMVGTFTSGACDRVIADTEMAEPFAPTTVERWGGTWTIGGGTFDFEDDLGKQPLVVVCGERADKIQLLLYHFLVAGDPKRPTAAWVADTLASKPVQAAARAFLAGTTAPVVPLHRPDVRNRGTIEASRDVDLPAANLRVHLPDDGLVWMFVRLEGGGEMLQKMAPAFPYAGVEVARFAGLTCVEAFGALASVRTTAPPILGMPAAFVVGPTLAIDGQLEHVGCRPEPDAVLLVGVFSASTDVTPYRELLGAIAAAPRSHD